MNIDHFVSLNHMRISSYITNSLSNVKSTKGKKSSAGETHSLPIQSYD